MRNPVVCFDEFFNNLCLVCVCLLFKYTWNGPRLQSFKDLVDFFNFNFCDLDRLGVYFYSWHPINDSLQWFNSSMEFKSWSQIFCQLNFWSHYSPVYLFTSQNQIWLWRKCWSFLWCYHNFWIHICLHILNWIGFVWHQTNSEKYFNKNDLAN